MTIPRFESPRLVFRLEVESENHGVPLEVPWRVYDEAGNVIETHEHKGDFKEW